MAEFTLTIDDELCTDEVKQFVEEANNCASLYSKKNHDYGNSFEKGMDTIGVAYGVGRLYDKINRLITLTTSHDKKQAVTNESIEDTLRDSACYSIMLLCYIQRKNKQMMNNIVME